MIHIVQNHLDQAEFDLEVMVVDVWGHDSLTVRVSIRCVPSTNVSVRSKGLVELSLTSLRIVSRWDSWSWGWVIGETMTFLLVIFGWDNLFRGWVIHVWKLLRLTT